MSYFILEPKFVQDPTIANTYLNIGQRVNIVGCNLHSPVKLKTENMYWLKNGKLKIPTNFITLTEEAIKGFIYVFHDLRYITTNYTMQGFYQCVVSDPMLKEIKSKKVDIQFEGNTAINIASYIIIASTYLFDTFCNIFEFVTSSVC